MCRHAPASGAAVTTGELALLASRLLLILTFFVAGLTKIGAPRQSMQTLRDFGVPSVLRGLGLLLAPVELFVAAGLTFAATALYAARSATALLAVFILGIAANLWRGRTPNCNCFGQVRPAPIGWTTVARDGVLIACAAWLLASDNALSTNLWSSLALLTSMQRRIVIIAAAALLFALLTDTRRDPSASDERAWDTSWDDDESLAASPAAVPRSTVHAATARVAADTTGTLDPPEPLNHVRHMSGVGLDVGTPIPDVSLADFDGQRYPIASLLTNGTSVAFVFSSPNCPSCQTLMSWLPGLAEASAPDLQVVLVTRGTKEENLEKLDQLGPVRLLRQDGYEVSEAFNDTTTPAAVIVSPEGRIETKLAQGPLAVAKLITATSNRLRMQRVEHADGVATNETPRV